MGSPGSLGLITGLKGVRGGAQENLVEPMAPIVMGAGLLGLLKGGHRETQVGGKGSGKAEGAGRGVRVCYPGQEHTLWGGPDR